MTYKNYVVNAKKWIGTQAGTHISQHAMKMADEMYEVEMGRQTIDEFAANVPELDDAPTLNYIRENIIHYYPD